MMHGQQSIKIYMIVLSRWSSRVEPQGWPSLHQTSLCILILWSCKVFFFQRKVERKVENLLRMKEAATRLLTQFSVNVKNKICSCKTKKKT